MSWRTVVIANNAKLDLKLDCMVVRKEDATQRIFLGEIAVLIIETTAVSITAALLAELTKRKVKVIFCDEKRNPSSELISYYGCHDTSMKVRTQVEWSEEIKGNVWTEIVREKIYQQYMLLQILNRKEADMLQGYMKEIEYRDSTNREGHAAKVYFNTLFGKDFTRAQESPVNAALNYGYGILLSLVNREIVANGYITQLGLFHDNMFNQFNLGSDLMEPLRPLVDQIVVDMEPNKFEKEEKRTMIQMLDMNIIVDGNNCYLLNAVKVYVKSVFDAINEKDISHLRFCRNEL